MNPLDEVIDWYEFNINQQKFFMEIVKNSHKIMTNTVANAIIAKYNLSSSKKDEIKKEVDKSKIELADLTIVSLWAVFEAFLNDKIKEKTDQITNIISDTLSNQIANYAFNESDRWVKDNVLDLYKSIISDPDIVGDVKEVYKYRNWVAHGKARRKPFNLDPFVAYQKLTKFLIEAELIEEQI